MKNKILFIKTNEKSFMKEYSSHDENYFYKCTLVPEINKNLCEITYFIFNKEIDNNGNIKCGNIISIESKKSFENKYEVIMTE